MFYSEASLILHEAFAMSPFPATLWLPAPRPVFIVLAALLLCPPPVHAASASEINREVDKALARFQQFDGARAYLDIARGVLVFPKVYMAGIGGEYGEGALRVDGKTVDYYSTAAASIGFQPRAQAKTLIVVFTREDALNQFRTSAGWKVGVDGAVVLVDLGADKAVEPPRIKDPVVGFVFGQKGLMYKVTLEGAQFTRLRK
jgi:lipid-binding SYLF domain-containing protein